MWLDNMCWMMIGYIRLGLVRFVEIEERLGEIDRLVEVGLISSCFIICQYWLSPP